VIARCNNREPWALIERDHRVLRWILSETAERFGWVVLAYCQMSNHYHILVQTPEGNLSKSMHALNRSFAGWFNFTYGRVGHVFQDRYIGILVEEREHLVRTFRYVLRNPVAARIAREPADWRWSSARAVVGREHAPEWLDWAPVADVLGGPEMVLPFLYAGDDDGLTLHEFHLAATRPSLDELALSLDDPKGVARARYIHGYSVSELAAFLRCSEMTIRRRLEMRADARRGR
jgi:REP element-mobilizing transposase RayT